MEKVIEINAVKALDMIDQREPLGFFYYEDEGVFIGIDNSVGECFMEEFDSKKECLKWLLEYNDYMSELEL